MDNTQDNTSVTIPPAIADQPVETEYPPVSVPSENSDLPLPASIEPMVVMPVTQPPTSFLFYLIFIITVVIFVIISYLLFNSFKNNKANNQTAVVIPTIRPTATPIAAVPTLTPIPVDSEAVKLRTVSDSDEISSIEADIQGTDLSSIPQSIRNLDTLFNFSLKK
jgi:hypothetical protein